MKLKDTIRRILVCGMLIYFIIHSQSIVPKAAFGLCLVLFVVRLGLLHFNKLKVKDKYVIQAFALWLLGAFLLYVGYRDYTKEGIWFYHLLYLLLSSVALQRVIYGLYYKNFSQTPLKE